MKKFCLAVFALAAANAVAIENDEDYLKGLEAPTGWQDFE
jgi:hypothetical protein